MAVDEAIFLQYLQGEAPPTLRFYGWNPPAVSIGFFQSLDREVDREACRLHGFQWVRRPTGGRAVLHHHELTYAIVVGERDGIESSLLQSYRRIAMGLALGLRLYGIDVLLHAGRTETDGRLAAACFASPSWHELTVGGKKLVGSAQLRRKNALLQHGSILTDFDPGLLLAVLGHGRGNQRLREELLARITSCRAVLGRTIDPQELIPGLVQGMTEALDIDFAPGELTPAERELARDLERCKYSRPAWNDVRGGNSRI